MQRVQIIVCFGSGSAFVGPSSDMPAVPTDAAATVLASANSRMYCCSMSMCFVVFEAMELLAGLIDPSLSS
jgi:hypothetical protein